MRAHNKVNKMANAYYTKGCPYCGKGFNSLEFLKSHIFNVHKDQVERIQQEMRDRKKETPWFLSDELSALFETFS